VGGISCRTSFTIAFVGKRRREEEEKKGHDLAGKIHFCGSHLIQERLRPDQSYQEKGELVFTANPEDYTARGKGIGSEITTHYHSRSSWGRQLKKFPPRADISWRELNREKREKGGDRLICRVSLLSYQRPRPKKRGKKRAPSPYPPNLLTS